MTALIKQPDRRQGHVDPRPDPVERRRPDVVVDSHAGFIVFRPTTAAGRRLAGDALRHGAVAVVEWALGYRGTDLCCPILDAMIADGLTVGAEHD